MTDAWQLVVVWCVSGEVQVTCHHGDLCSATGPSLQGAFSRPSPPPRCGHLGSAAPSPVTVTPFYLSSHLFVCCLLPFVQKLVSWSNDGPEGRLSCVRECFLPNVCVYIHLPFLSSSQWPYCTFEICLVLFPASLW